MARIDPIPADRLTPRQREVHDKIASGPRKGVRGPLAVWLHSPDLAERAQALGEYLRYGALEPRLSELAILVTARHWTSHYEWFVHAPIAERQGIAAEAVEAIKTRREPTLARADERAVYRFAREALETGAVSDAAFADAERMIGTKGVVDLAAILGYYTLGAMTLAASRTALPDGTQTCLPE